MSMKQRDIPSLSPESHASVPMTPHTPRQQPSSWQSFLRYSGAGFLVAIAYVDPGNLEADLQVW
jgi:hypothetical protein